MYLRYILKGNNMITRPQKAPSKSITDGEIEALTFPLLGSPKLDGFRCITNKISYTSTMKPIGNKFIQGILSRPEYMGLDGELIVGAPNDPNAFNNTTGAVRRSDGEPDFTFYVFDVWALGEVPYSERLAALELHCEGLPFVKVLPQTSLFSLAEVLAFEEKCVVEGYEGAMIRTMKAPYKEGRCTLKEKNIFKRKPVEDDEGVVVGFFEQLENQNEAQTNEMGLTFRQSNQENKAGKNTLGGLILQSKLWIEPIRVGTGLGMSDAFRAEVWANKEKYLGKTFCYKYQKHGSINAPRQPIGKGFREANDLTKY